MKRWQRCNQLQVEGSYRLGLGPYSHSEYLYFPGSWVKVRYWVKYLPFGIVLKQGYFESKSRRMQFNFNSVEIFLPWEQFINIQLTFCRRSLIICMYIISMMSVMEKGGLRGIIITETHCQCAVCSDEILNSLSFYLQPNLATNHVSKVSFNLTNILG